MRTLTKVLIVAVLTSVFSAALLAVADEDPAPAHPKTDKKWYVKTGDVHTTSYAPAYYGAHGD